MDSNRKRELLGGGLLFGAAILALIFANSAFLIADAHNQALQNHKE